MITVAFIAAMPEEVKPFLRKVSATREHLRGFPFYRFAIKNHQACLIQSGMGPEHAGRAAEIVLEQVRPEIVVSFGFCGAASPGPEAGDLVVADAIYSFEKNILHNEKYICNERATALVSGLPVSRTFRGTFISTHEIVSKEAIASILPPALPYPVLEMETAAVARVAQRKGVPIVGIRAVSDDAGEELGFSLSEFTDAEMRIRPFRVVMTVLRKPWIIPQLIRLSRNTKLAGEKLARGLKEALEILPDEG